MSKQDLTKRTERRLLPVSQTAEYLGVSEAAVRAYERKGKIPSVRLFGRVFFDVSELDQVIDAAKAA